MKTVQRFRVLDAFRGIAALLVFFYHMPSLSLLTDNAFINSSGVFVDLFFVLSGFVIYHNYQHNIIGFNSSYDFLKKRIKRLLPLHLFTLSVMVLLELAKYPLQRFLPFNEAPFEINTLASFWPQLFLLNSTPLFMGFNWNGQNWSISAEIIAYLIFVIASLLWSSKKVNRVLLSTLIIIGGYLFFYRYYNNFNILSDFDFSFIRGTIGFFVGVMSYIIRNQIFTYLQKLSVGMYQFLELLILVMVVYLVCHLDIYVSDFYVYHLAFGGLIIIFSMEKGWISTILKFKIFQNLGLWSYSIYLNHILITVVFRMIAVKVFGIEGFTALICELVTLYLLCLYSSQTYNYVERRFYNPRTTENSVLPTHNSEAQNQE